MSAKISFGSMVLGSDALLRRRQEIEVFYLPAIEGHCSKLSVEQRLVNEDNTTSAPASFRFSSSGQLRAFLADVFLPAYLHFALQEGKQKDFVVDDLRKLVGGLRDFERCGGR